MNPRQPLSSSSLPAAAAAWSECSSYSSAPSLLSSESAAAPLPVQQRRETPCFATCRRPIADEESVFRHALQQAKESANSINESIVRCVQEVTTRKKEFLSSRDARKSELVDLASRTSTLCQRILQLREQTPLRTKPESVLSAFNEIQALEIKSHFMQDTLRWLREVYSSVEFKEAFEAITSNNDLEMASEMVAHNKKSTNNFSAELKTRLYALYDDIVAIFNDKNQSQEPSTEDLASQFDSLTLSESSLPSPYAFSNSKWFSWHTPFHKTGVKIHDDVAKQLYNLHITLDCCIKMCCTGIGEQVLTSDRLQLYETACEHFAKKLAILRTELLAIQSNPQLSEGLAYISRLQELIQKIHLQIAFLKDLDVNKFDSIVLLLQSLSTFLTSKSETEKLASLTSLAKQFSIMDSSQHPLILRTIATVRGVLTHHGTPLVQAQDGDESIRRDIVAGTNLLKADGQLADRIKLYLMRNALKCLYYTKEHSDTNFNLALLSLGKLSKRTSDTQFSLVIDHYREFNEFNHRIDILELFPEIFQLLDAFDTSPDSDNIKQIHNFLTLKQLLDDVQNYIFQTQSAHDRLQSQISGKSESIQNFEYQITAALESKRRLKEHLDFLDLQKQLNHAEILQLNHQLEEAKIERERSKQALESLNYKREDILEAKKACEKVEAKIRLLRQTDSNADVSMFNADLLRARQKLNTFGKEVDFRDLDRVIAEHETRGKSNEAQVQFFDSQISRKQRESIDIETASDKNFNEIQELERAIEKLRKHRNNLVNEKTSLLEQQPKVSHLINQLNGLACERFSRFGYVIHSDEALITALSQALYSKNSDLQNSGLATIASKIDGQNATINPANSYLMTALQLYAVMQFCLRERLLNNREKADRVSLIEEKALIVALHHYVHDTNWRALLTDQFTYPILELVLYRLIQAPECIVHNGKLNGTQDPLNTLRSAREPAWFDLVQRYASQPITPDLLQQLQRELELLPKPQQAETAQ